MTPRRRDDTVPASPSFPGPLAGKRIVVTRPAEQAEGLRHALEARGAHAVLCPTVRLAAPERWGPLDAVLGQLGDYDWIVFTSANGVRFTLDRVEEVGTGREELAAARVAVVGDRTARTLTDRGFPVAFVAPGEGSVALAEALDAVEGAAILTLRSDRSDPAAADVLRRRGARHVREVVAYRTVPAAPEGVALDELRAGIDAITFTSPSTVQGFLALGAEWRSLLSGAIVATLGPTTTGAARDAGLRVEEAAERSMEGLVDALVRAFERKGASGGGRREGSEGAR